MEAGPFGNAAGDDRRDGGREGEEEEELGHLVAITSGRASALAKKLTWQAMV